MEWNQGKINEWALKTFGEATPQHMMARAIQECGELLMEITKSDISSHKIAEECADIIGPLCRVAAYADCDLSPAFEASGFIIPNQLYGPAIRVMGKLVFIMQRLASTNIISNDRLANLLGSVVIDIAEICAAVDANLGAEIDKKMAILLTRDWILDGNGAGHHIKHGIMTSNQAAEHYGIRSQYRRCALGNTCKPGECVRRPECPYDD